MAYLTEKEKKELLRMAKSEELRKDFKKMAENTRKQKMTPDEYIRFLTSASKVFSPFQKSPRKTHQI